MKTKLLAIQTELKAPKNQINKFGGYNYRSCEDILEAVKPLTKKHNCTLILTDEIIEVGGRIYVKSTARIEDNEKGSDYMVQCSAFAREADIQKGMSEPQITGSASSYARKYALNGLFLIDDTKDDDATNTHGKDSKPEEKQKGVIDSALKAVESCPDKESLNKIKNLMNQRSWTKEEHEQLEKAIEQKEGIL